VKNDFRKSVLDIIAKFEYGLSVSVGKEERI